MAREDDDAVLGGLPSSDEGPDAASEGKAPATDLAAGNDDVADGGVGEGCPDDERADEFPVAENTADGMAAADPAIDDADGGDVEGDEGVAVGEGCAGNAEAEPASEEAGDTPVDSPIYAADDADAEGEKGAADASEAAATAPRFSKRAKVIACVAVALALVGGGVFAAYRTVAPSLMFAQAEAASVAGDYATAYDLYSQLGDYHDCESKLPQCRFNLFAQWLAKQGVVSVQVNDNGKVELASSADGQIELTYIKDIKTSPSYYIKGSASTVIRYGDAQAQLAGAVDAVLSSYANGSFTRDAVWDIATYTPGAVIPWVNVASDGFNLEKVAGMVDQDATAAARQMSAALCNALERSRTGTTMDDLGFKAYEQKKPLVKDSAPEEAADAGIPPEQPADAEAPSEQPA